MALTDSLIDALGPGQAAPVLAAGWWMPRPGEGDAPIGDPPDEDWDDDDDDDDDEEDDEDDFDDE
jgi:hypothetical protein